MPIDAESLFEFEVPTGWSCFPLDDLVAKDRGVSYGVVQPGKHTEDGVPIVRVNNLRDGRILTEDVMRVQAEVESGYGRTRLRGGEVLLSIVGTLGECAVVPNELAGWNVARAVAVIPPKSNVDPHWLKLCLRSANVQALIRGWATTTVQATLNLRDLRRLPILLPPENKRHDITAAVGHLDDKIEQNRRTGLALETLARATFKAWFLDFEPVKAKAAGQTSFPGMPSVVFAALPARLVDSTHGLLPEGWVRRTLAEAFDINPPRRLSKGQDAPYLDMKSMPTAGHAPDEWDRRPHGSGMRFVNGDTLMARITPCLENGKTAFVDFLEEGEVAWGSTEYIVMRPKPPLPEVFAYCLARTPEFREFAIQNMTGTSGRQRVAASALEHYHIAVPDAVTARAFGDLVVPLFNCIQAGKAESRKLATLRDYLLPRLLSGAVSIQSEEVP